MTTMKIMCMWYCFFRLFHNDPFFAFFTITFISQEIQEAEIRIFFRVTDLPLFRNFFLIREQRLIYSISYKWHASVFYILKKIIFLLNDAKTALVSFFRLDDTCWLWVGFFSAWLLNISLGWTNIFSDGHFASTDTFLYQKHNRENKMFQHVSMYVSCCFLKYKKIVLISFFLKFSINQLTYAGHNN